MEEEKKVSEETKVKMPNANPYSELPRFTANGPSHTAIVTRSERFHVSSQCPIVCP